MNHLIDVDEAVEYLKQFAWVEDFDLFIQQILEPKENDDEGL